MSETPKIQQTTEANPDLHPIMPNDPEAGYQIWPVGDATALGSILSPEKPQPVEDLSLGAVAIAGVAADSKKQWGGYFDNDFDDYGSPSLNVIEQPSHTSSPEDPLIDVPPTEKPGTFKEEAPAFADQVEDTTRTNTITYVSGVRDALSGKTENTGHREVTLTEHKTLVGLRDFLHDVAQSIPRTELGREAADMLSDLTFIGGREYAKAAEAIAADWRERLAADPQLQLCVVTGKIIPEEAKSDTYLLENVLKNFTDDEVERFKDRLLFNIDDVTARPEHTAVIVLDDWVISGGQLGAVADKIRLQHPEYLPALEVQLIAASKRLINKGLLVGYRSYNGKRVRQDYVPVHAYYQAHTARTDNRVRITGATCAVDYGFNDVIGEMSQAMGRDMPPGTNIVRPYRSSNVRLTQIERFMPSLAKV